MIAGNEHAEVVGVEAPLAPGHARVVARRAVASWWDATDAERAALMALVGEVKRALDLALAPSGYTLRIDSGRIDGRAVDGLAVDVIPRFDPPTGASPGPLATGGLADPFSRHVLPVLERAQDVAILAAFVQQSGLDRIAPHVEAALARGARLRVLTGDYLEITQVEALETLLDWQRSAEAGRLEARVVEVGGEVRSFHPKSWRLEGPGLAVAFVGSSNLSRAALDHGVEWNLRVEAADQPRGYARVRDAFDALWAKARPLDPAWVTAYAGRVAASPRPAPPAEVEPEEPRRAEAPHEVQREALAALRALRAEGKRRALVVLATGLGKKWLAAFDHAQLEEELGRPARLLFVAHREELLRQAAQTFRRLARARGRAPLIGWCAGDSAELDADLVFASVAKLSRLRDAALSFDVVVIDEVHHAAAPSYRRILARVDPRFLVGLTATPDRADGADIHALFGDEVAYQAGVGRGIELGRLVPFRYHGVKDDVDYAPIPWRNRRFDPATLAAALESERRMETLWRAWAEHPGQRTIVFCASVAHAVHVRTWLGARGVRVAAVFGAPGSDDREGALSDLARGALDAVCAVDLFNEGVDLPAIDRVVMLRPTESSVVFLQQLGRGLRASEGKAVLKVIDFVGNHRVFVGRLRTLLSLGSSAPQVALRRLLQGEDAELPPGCAVELELEAKALLEAMVMGARGAVPSGPEHVEARYRELADALGRRPSAAELAREGCNLGALARRHGGWFEFVSAMGDLDADEVEVAGRLRPLLRELEQRPRAGVVEALALLGLADLVPVLASELSARVEGALSRRPGLGRGETPGEGALTRLERALEPWMAAGADGRAWVVRDGERLSFALRPPVELESAAAALLAELAEHRLERASLAAPDRPGLVCNVIRSGANPIIKLHRDVPRGELSVRIPDGSAWTFRMMKEFCNVAHPAEGKGNALGGLLRGWFGPSAGHPGTSFRVRFFEDERGWRVAPVERVAEALEPGAVLDARALARHFGLERFPERSGVEGGHRFVLVEPEAEAPPVPWAVALQVAACGAHVLVREGTEWRYLGVGEGA